jgi:Ca2+-binding EF-hand superfamily protein
MEWIMTFLRASTAGGFFLSIKGLIAGTATVLILAAALAGPARAADDVAAVFAIFDSNGDGVIDRTEFDLNKIKVISVLDRNQNDHLDRDEVKVSDENFQTADQDGDGMISGFEFVESPFGKFEAFDADGDGVITLEEFRAYVEDLRL